MELHQQLLGGVRGNNSGSEPNTSSMDEVFAGISSLTKGVVELIVIQTLTRVIGPVFEPLIRKLVKEEIGFALKPITSMNGNSGMEASTSVPRSLQLEFQNKISLPVLTGRKIVGQNQTPISIALVDSQSGQIVNSGTESTAKVEIVVLPQSSDDGKVKIVSERKVKKILQGNTYVTLKAGIGFVGEISFTHNAEWTRNGTYRLGARIANDTLRTRVGEARTEAFPVKDRRSTLYEKHHPPSLSDRVYHLEQISNKGKYYKRLCGADINTVKDLLILLFTKPKRLEEVLTLKASSRAWKDIVDHAKECDGMFLYLDPSLGEKTGVVFDAKRQLKGSIINSQYITVDELSEERKVDAQNKAMSKHMEKLKVFEDEISLRKFLQPDVSFNLLRSPGPRLGISQMIDGPSTSSQVIDSPLDRTGTLNSIHNTKNVEFSPENVCDMDGGSHHPDIVMSTPENRRKEIPLEGELTHCASCDHPPCSSFPLCLESLNDIDIVHQITERHAHDLAQPGTSSQVCRYEGNSELLCQSPSRPIRSPDYKYHFCHYPNYDSNTNGQWLNYIHNMVSESSESNHETRVLVAEGVPFCNSAQIRWTKASKVLRFLSTIRRKIGIPERIHAHKKQRCY